MARNTSVTLGSHFDEFVSEKISQGRFQSVSEVVRAGLHKLEEDESKLQALKEKLQAGENSPRVENFDSSEFLSKLHKNILNDSKLFIEGISSSRFGGNMAIYL